MSGGGKRLKITKVEAAPLFGDTPKGGWDSEIQPGDSLHAIVAVHTDGGIIGYGSAYTDGRLVQAGLKVLERFYLGENALEPERVTEKMHQNTFWMGRGGTLTHAISGIDIALWDILGKATRMPVGRLLGGTYRSRVLPYCSLLMEEPGRMAEVVADYRERGFRAFKIGWGPFGRRNERTDEAIVAAAREAIGPDVELMVDAGGSDGYWPHGYKWAIQTARMLANYDVTWFEEALRPDDLEGYVKLTEHSPVPIASCEVLTRRQSFLPWIERRAVDYIQPDVTKVGGLTEEHRIGQYADEHSIMLVPHGWNTAVGLAADLQLVAAAGNARWVEYITPAPYIEDLCETPPKLDENGMLRIPDGPGLGFRWNPDGIAKHTGGLKLTASTL